MHWSCESLWGPSEKKHLGDPYHTDRFLRVVDHAFGSLHASGREPQHLHPRKPLWVLMWRVSRLMGSRKYFCTATSSSVDATATMRVEKVSSARTGWSKVACPAIKQNNSAKSSHPLPPLPPQPPAARVTNVERGHGHVEDEVQCPVLLEPQTVK